MPQPTLLIGGGIAAIVAALDLLDRNLPVTLIDRDHEAAFGGLAQWSFGGFFIVDSPQQRKLGIQDSPALALSDWLATARFAPHDHWPRQWAEAYVSNCRTQVYDWLTAKGLTFLPAVQWIERGMYGPGNSVPRFHMVWGLGRGLVDTLKNRLLNHPNRSLLTLRFDARVTGIVQSGGKVTGVKGVGEKDGQAFEVRGAQVVLACGGLTGDLEVMRTHWNPDFGSFPQNLLSGTHPFADGSAHRLATEANGQVTYPERQWCYAGGVTHPDARFAWHGLSLVPPKSALWLNARGERIGPVPLVSGFDTRFMVEQVSRQPEPWSWHIMNRKIAVKEMAVSGSQFNEALVKADKAAFVKTLLFGNPGLVDELVARCPDFLTAATLPELAEKMNALEPGAFVDPAVLEATVRRWDAQVQLPAKFQNDDQLRRIDHARQYLGDRLRTCARQPILDPKAGPLLAVRMRLLVRKTLGGIVTDLDCRVLDAGGEPIPGLYAIGEAAGYGGGGVHGHGALEGTFLGGCVFTARRLVAAL